MSNYQDNTCSNCIHRVKITDPQDIGADKGECRRMPPGFALIPSQQGLASACGYPQVPSNYPACGEYKGEIAILAEREPLSDSH